GSAVGSWGCGSALPAGSGSAAAPGGAALSGALFVGSAASGKALECGGSSASSPAVDVTLDAGSGEVHAGDDAALGALVGSAFTEAGTRPAGHMRKRVSISSHDSSSRRLCGGSTLGTTSSQ